MQAGAVQDLNIVLKGDVQGSVEAIVSELGKIAHPEVRVNVIHTGVGGISENDVNLAAASNAMVVGFNVRPSADVRALADRQGIEIRLYRVIYQLTEEIEKALVGMLSPVETEAILGEVEVRALFKVSRLGTIAGCMVTSGVVRRGASVRIFRDGTRIHETTVAQLRRFKDDAREVTEGFECGIHAHRLQRPARGRRLRGLRDARGRAHVARRAAGRGRGAVGLVAGLRARGLRGDPDRRAALSRSGVAEGEAPLRALGEGQPAQPLRRRRSPRSTITTSGSAAR